MSEASIRSLNALDRGNEHANKIQWLTPDPIGLPKHLYRPNITETK